MDLSPGGRSRPRSGPLGSPLSGADCWRILVETVKTHPPLAEMADLVLVTCS